MARRIAVMGAGAIGSSVSADLIEAGHEITVIDQWPAQVEAIRTSGLRVTMPDHEARVVVPALHLCELASSGLQFDIVFMAVKGYDHRWMAELIKPYLALDGVLVGVQNGMNDDSLASIVGPERTVGCVVELSAEIFTPGIVQRNTTRKGTWFALGELDTSDITPRVRELASLLGHVGRVDIAARIRGAKWTKLIANTTDLERIASNDEADVPALQGWRREIFGNDALALKRGELALAAKGDKVSVIRLPPET